MIFFNVHAFVIPTYKSPIDDPQDWAHILEDALELTVRVDDKNCNHAEQDNEIIHEKFFKMFRMYLCSNSRYNKLR